MIKKSLVIEVIKYLTLTLGALMVIVPLYIVISAAFKTKLEFASSFPLSIPNNMFNFDNFLEVFEKGKIGLGFLNTAYILVFSLVGNVMLGTMSAYAIGRFEFKLKKVIMGAYALSVIIPTITTQVATFSVIKNLHLMNTRFSVILIYLGTDIIQLFIYLQFINNIPYELDECAIIEGASLFKIYRSIILPLLMPATVTVVIMKTIAIYNDIYLPYLYMPDQRLSTISTSLMRFNGSISVDWNVLSSAAVIVMLPLVILYLFLQKYIFAGITQGAVKG